MPLRPKRPTQDGNEILRARLRQNEQVFRLLVESVREYAIFLIDTGGVVATWNKGAERLKGYRADEIIGQHFSTFYPPHVPRYVIDDELVVAVREGVFKDEGWRLRKDGTQFWADVTITPVYDDNGALLAFAKVTRDLTDRRRTEDDRAARLAAERADRVKDEFLATLSHELRTPLNAILGWAHIIRQGADAETVTRGIETISRNASVQNQLIGDILDVQRLSTGKLRLDLRELDPIKPIEAAIETLRPAAEAKEIRVTALLDAQAGLILGDPDRLQQVVWNLLSNAIKFTPQGGRIAVRLMSTHSQVEISVEDNGPGIDPEFVPHIFERFRQRDSSATRRHGGLGLGLSIVRSLVELHGGSVSAANRTEGGAVFSVRLPPVNAMRTQDARTRVASEQVWLDAAPSVHGITVLVVDDEADGREIVGQILERCGAEVLTAASAREAFEILTRARPHVIVCDIGMPEEDGYSLIRRVRDLPASEGGLTPAAALTAFASTEDRIRALTAGFQMHVPKPVQPAELATVVTSLSGHARRGRA
jgi:PAS domain S-box-containing protein